MNSYVKHSADVTIMLIYLSFKGPRVLAYNIYELIHRDFSIPLIIVR